MKERIIALSVVAAGLTLSAMVVAPPSSAESAKSGSATNYVPKKTAWGDPDLQGMWPVQHLEGTPFQRPEKYGDNMYITDAEYAKKEKMLKMQRDAYDREVKNNKIGMGHWAEAGDANRRNSLLVDPKNGRLPEMTEAGKEASAKMRSSWQKIDFNTPADFDSWDRCITRGLPASMFPFHYNNGIRILQAPGYVVIDMEMIHEARIIPLDGRKAPPQKVMQWMGFSRGHWEGNTLVIETTNIHPGASVLNVGTVGVPPGDKMPMSKDAKITERLTPTGPNSIDYKITYSDPKYYKASWTADLPWQRDPSYRMYEYACHEDNSMIRHYIDATKAKKAQQASNTK
jgi:hypothetical protein